MKVRMRMMMATQMTMTSLNVLSGIFPLFEKQSELENILISFCEITTTKMKNDNGDENDDSNDTLMIRWRQ